MAGGMAMGSGPAKRYPGHTTPYVIIACIVAASGGALFGSVTTSISQTLAHATQYGTVNLIQHVRWLFSLFWKVHLCQDNQAQRPDLLRSGNLFCHLWRTWLAVSQEKEISVHGVMIRELAHTICPWLCRPLCCRRAGRSRRNRKCLLLGKNLSLILGLAILQHQHLPSSKS